jgi:pilus assembly protein CpaB
VNRTARGRRALVLLSLALACGGLAASRVGERERRVEAQVGSPVPVLIAAREIGRGTRLTARRARRFLAVRQVPERFAPPDALSTPADALGLRLAAGLPSGAYLTAAAFEAGSRDPGGSALGPGERALELPVSGGDSLRGVAGGRGRVDVLVTTEPRASPGRTFVALEDVELLGARAQESLGAAGRETADTLATLRVSARQAVYLTAAASFARELRLLARSPGDRRRVGHPSVSAADL